MDVIQNWGISVKGVSLEVWDHLEKLAEADFEHERDEENLFGGAYIYKFRIELQPIVLRATVAYDLQRIQGETKVTILDFRAGFPGE